VSMLGASSQPLAEIYDVALLDLDGVVYVGPAAVRNAAAALAEATRLGMRFAFVTNNASRTPTAVAEQLARLGVPARDEEVVTSAQAAARLLAERLAPGSRVLLVGGEGLEVALVEQGLVPVSSTDDHPAAVVQGFGPDVGWRALAEASFAVGSGLPWVATNADPTLPTPRGAAPGNGALVQAVATATGRHPEVAGKPELPMHREAMLRSSAERPLVVGDRLDTDIEGAQRGGVDSLLVLTGVTGPVDVVLAPPQQRPTYISQDLTGLTRSHPAVEGGDGAATCRGWRARMRDGHLELAGEGAGADPLDGLRAACVASWTAPQLPLAAAVARALEASGVGPAWAASQVRAH